MVQAKQAKRIQAGKRGRFSDKSRSGKDVPALLPNNLPGAGPDWEGGVDSSLGPTCRVCHRISDKDGICTLLSPCCCAGDRQYVHSSCLMSQRSNSGPFSRAFWECSACGASYRMKYRSHWLRCMTSMYFFVPAFLLTQVAMMIAASEVFKHMWPYILQWSMGSSQTHGEKDLNESHVNGTQGEAYLSNATSDTANFSVILPGLNVDVGYWVGGLLIMVLVRKIFLQREHCSSISYITFLPTFCRCMDQTTRDNDPAWDGWSGAMLHSLQWYLLVPYSFYNIWFMLRASYAFLHDRLLHFAGEQVVDFIAKPCIGHQKAGKTISQDVLGPCNGVVVSNCGTAEFNGLYIRSGENEGKPRYLHETGLGQTINYLGGHWFIGKNYSGCCYTSRDVGGLPTANWRTNKTCAKDPAPKLEAYCPVAPLHLSNLCHESAKPPAQVNDQALLALPEPLNGCTPLPEVDEKQMPIAADANQAQPTECNPSSSAPQKQNLLALAETSEELKHDPNPSSKFTLENGSVATRGPCTTSVAKLVLSPSEDPQIEEDEDGMCVCCMEQRAIFAVKGCRHEVACRPCRRRLVYRQLKLNTPDNLKTLTIPPMRLLTNKLLERTAISCPLCRHDGVLQQVTSA